MDYKGYTRRCLQFAYWHENWKLSPTGREETLFWTTPCDAWADGASPAHMECIEKFYINWALGKSPDEIRREAPLRFMAELSCKICEIIAWAKIDEESRIKLEHVAEMLMPQEFSEPADFDDLTEWPKDKTWDSWDAENINGKMGWRKYTQKELDEMKDFEEQWAKREQENQKDKEE